MVFQIMVNPLLDYRQVPKLSSPLGQQHGMTGRVLLAPLTLAIGLGLLILATTGLANTGLANTGLASSGTAAAAT